MACGQGEYYRGRRASTKREILEELKRIELIVAVQRFDFLRGGIRHRDAERKRVIEEELEGARERQEDLKAQIEHCQDLTLTGDQTDGEARPRRQSIGGRIVKPSELTILLGEGEGSMLEYKESLSSSFARELVALANSAGGKILLGVRDDGTVKGIADSNKLRARIQDIARNCDPPVKVLAQRVGKVLVVTCRQGNLDRPEHGRTIGMPGGLLSTMDPVWSVNHGPGLYL